MHRAFSKFGVEKFFREKRLIFDHLSSPSESRECKIEQMLKSAANNEEMRAKVQEYLQTKGGITVDEAQMFAAKLQKRVTETQGFGTLQDAEVKKLFAAIPQTPEDLLNFVVKHGVISAAELSAASAAGGRNGEKAKKETKASLESKVRSSRADIDVYNSKRAGILKDYESQKYKNPAERRKAYKEACAKIHELRTSMGDPVGTYWENRNQWEKKSKQSWSRKLAVESGRDVLDAPRKKEQARVIRIIDEKTGKLLAAYDEWTANYTGSIRQADALALIRNRQDDLEPSGGRNLDLRIDASGVKRFGDEEPATKKIQNDRGQQNLKILARRDSIGTKLDGLQGYKGRMTKKYRDDAEADVAKEMRKKSSGRIDARALAQANYAAEREMRSSSIKEEMPSAALERYKGDAGKILVVRKSSGDTLMEISLGSVNNLQEGQALDCWRADGSTAKYLCTAIVLRVEKDRAVVRMDRGMMMLTPSEGDTIGPRTEDWSRKGPPKPPTEASAPPSAPAVEAPKPVPSSMPGMTFEEGNEFMRPIDTSPEPTKPKSIPDNVPTKPDTAPKAREPINIPSAPPDPKTPEPKKALAEKGPFSHVEDADEIVAELDRDTEKAKSDRANIPALQRTQVFGEGAESLQAGLELAGLRRKNENIPDTISVKPGDLVGKAKIESQSPTEANENMPLTIDEIRKIAPIVVDRLVGYGKKLQSIDEVFSLVANTVKKLNMEDKYSLAIGTSALQKIQQERPDLFAPPGGVHFRAELYQLGGQYLIPSVEVDYPNAIKPEMSIFADRDLDAKPRTSAPADPVKVEKSSQRMDSERPNSEVKTDAEKNARNTLPEDVRTMFERLKPLFSDPDLAAKNITFLPLHKEGDTVVFEAKVFEDRNAKFEVREDGIVQTWNVVDMKFSSEAQTISKVKAELLEARRFFEERSKKEYTLAAVQKDGKALRYASQALRADRNVVREAVKKTGSALEYASPDLKNDRDTVLMAIKQEPRSLEFASGALRGDRGVILVAVKECGDALRYASASLKGDRDVVLAAVRQDGSALRYASEAFRADRAIVLEAAKESGFALEIASENFRSDREIVLETVKKYGLSLHVASETLRGDRDVVLAAARQNGFALEFASKELRDDEHIVTAACKAEPMALGFASARLRDRDEVVLEAVKSAKKKEDGPICFRFASDRLLGDKEFVKKVVAIYPQCLTFASEKVRNDPEVKMLSERGKNETEPGGKPQPPTPKSQSEKNSNDARREKKPFSSENADKSGLSKTRGSNSEQDAKKKFLETSLTPPGKKEEAQFDAKNTDEVTKDITSRPQFFDVMAKLLEKVPYRKSMQLDRRIVGDFNEIRDGVNRLPSVITSLSPEEQNALKMADINIIPKGAQSLFDGFSKIELDVTRDAEEVRHILQKELAPLVFQLRFRAAIKPPWDKITFFTGRLRNVDKIDPIKLAGDIMKTLSQGSEFQKSAVLGSGNSGWVATDHGMFAGGQTAWIILEDDQHEKGVADCLYYMNIHELDSFNEFFLRAYLGPDAAEKPEKLQSLIGQRSALEKAVNGCNKEGMRLVLDGGIRERFEEIQAGLPRLRELMDSNQLTQEEKEVVAHAIINPVGEKSSASSYFLRLDIAQTNDKIRDDIKREAKKLVYVSLFKKGFTKNISSPWDAEKFYFWDAPSSGKDALVHGEKVSKDVFEQLKTLPMPLQQKVQRASIYIYDSGEHRKVSDTIFDINIHELQTLHAFFKEALDETPRDNVYWNNREGEQKNITVSQKTIEQWLKNQSTFVAKLRSDAKVPCTQEFEPSIVAGLLRAQANTPGGITVTDVNSTGKAVRLNVDGEQWNIASDIYRDREDRYPGNLYLYKTHDIQSNKALGLLLPVSSLFRVDGTLDPERVRRYVALAKEYDESERADPAQIKDFDLVDRKKNDRFAMVTLGDFTDPVIKSAQGSNRNFNGVLSTHYDAKHVGQHLEVDVHEYANPVAAAEGAIRKTIAQEEGKGGVHTIVFNLLAHGDGTSAEFAGGTLRARQDLIPILQNPEFKKYTFVVRALSCYGAGLEEAMEDMTDEGGEKGRITVFLAGKRHTTNFLLDAKTGEMEKVKREKGAEEDDAKYVEIYEAVLATLISDPANKAKTFGELHLKADALAKIITLRNPGVWRSWGKEKSRQTAEVFLRRPDVVQA